MPAFLVAVRSLRNTPGFAVTALLTLGLGIGVATAVFTVADALLLRPLAVKDQRNVILLWGEIPRQGFDHYPLSLGDSREFVRSAASLQVSAILGYAGASPVSVQTGSAVSRFRRALVSGDYFEVLGTAPLLGRALSPGDDAAGAAPVAVLSYGAWLRRFSGDPRVLGRRLPVLESGITYTVVGVMRPGLDYPRGTDLWAPILATIPPEALEFAAFDIIGRLATHSTATLAGQELTTFLRRPGASPWQRDMRGVVRSFAGLVLGDVRPALMVFAIAAGLLLLITCANVATLLLVRGLDRSRELAVRAALGASRARIVAHLVAENAVLAVVGGVLGVLVAAVALRLFLAFAPPGMPRLDEIQLNGTVLGAALAITIISTLLFGMTPALLTAGANFQQALRLGRRHGPDRYSRRGVETLVAGQMALAMVVLVAAGLLARSLVKLERVQLALEPANLYIAQLALQPKEYPTAGNQITLIDRLIARVEGVPSIDAISPVVAVPFSGSGGWDGRAATEGQSVQDVAANPMLNLEVIAPTYFRTLGIPVLRGRGFSSQDREGAPGVTILSEAAARSYFPGQDPIGRHLKFGPELERTLTVVGIVPDTRYRDLRDGRATVYFPLHQSFFPFAPTTLAIRAHGASADVATALRVAVAGIGPGVALASIAPFDDLLEAPLAQPRLNAVLLGLFASAAILLAAVGLYGTMATMVGQRRGELALRQALGATPRAVNRLVLRRGLTIAIIGSLTGLLAVLPLGSLLSALLYDVGPSDPTTLAFVAALLLGTAGVATFLPARAASKIDPAVTLRADG